MELVPAGPSQRPSEDFELWPPGRFRTVPALSTLFLWRVSPTDSRSRDCKCSACGLTNMKTKVERCMNHLKTCPKRDQIDPLVVAEARQQFAKTVAGEKVQEKTARKIGQNEQKSSEIDIMLVELIAVNLLPVSLVEAEELSAIIKEAFPFYKIPSRKKLSSRLIPRVAEDARKVAFDALKREPSYSLTLECDAWTSVAGTSVVAITLTRHTGESYLLELSDASKERHTAEYLADLVANVLTAKEVPLKRINCLVTDEASNMKRARELICQNLDQDHIIHYRCMAHTFNLIIGSVCNHSKVKPYISKLVELIRRICLNKYLLAHIKSNAQAPVKVVPTRWYSVANSIKAMLDLHDDLLEVIADANLRADNIAGIVRDDDFWTNLRNLFSYFKEISKMIGVAEASDSRLSNFFRSYLEFLKLLENMPITSLRNIVFEAAILHLGKTDMNLVMCAYALDPNHRLEYLTSSALEIVEFVSCTMLIDMGYDDAVASQLRNELVSYQRRVLRVDSFVDDFYEWWNKQNLKVLRKIGLRMAACHGSSANTERIFSTLSSTITPSRNRLGLDLAFDLTSIRVLM